MRLLVQRINSSPSYVKAREWGKLIALTGSAQVVVQAFGFTCGLLVIRLLPTEEYAFYTLANTMLGTMIMFADSGISNGVMAEGGKVWQDKHRLGAVLTTGLYLRRNFGIYSMLIALPVLAYLLLQHGATWISTCLIILSIIPAFFAALSDSLLEVAPKLHQDIRPLQMNETGVGFGRLVLSALLLFFFPFTFVALIANGIPRIYGNFQLRKISSRFVDFNMTSDRVVRENVMKSVKRTLPNVIYYSVSGHIMIWLVTFYGSTASIAHVGALGRINIIFGLFAVLFSTLIVPRFSRMVANYVMIMRYFILIQAITLTIGTAILFFLWTYSEQLLWVLGNAYVGLDYELFLLGIAQAVGLMAGVCSQVVISRGWYMHPYLLIAINILTTVFALLLLDVSSLRGILMFNIAISITSYFLVFIYGLISISRTALLNH